MADGKHSFVKSVLDYLNNQIFYEFLKGMVNSGWFDACKLTCTWYCEKFWSSVFRVSRGFWRFSFNGAMDTSTLLFFIQFSWWVMNPIWAIVLISLWYQIVTPEYKLYSNVVSFKKNVKEWWLKIPHTKYGN